jgi:hypothetical protein
LLDPAALILAIAPSNKSLSMKKVITIVPMKKSPLGKK